MKAYLFEIRSFHGHNDECVSEYTLVYAENADLALQKIKQEFPHCAIFINRTIQ